MRELYQRKYGEEGCRQIKIVISSDLYDEVEKRAREMDMSPSQYARAALRASGEAAEVGGGGRPYALSCHRRNGRRSVMGKDIIAATQKFNGGVRVACRDILHNRRLPWRY